MSKTEQIFQLSPLEQTLTITRTEHEDYLDLTFTLDTAEPAILHWGLLRRAGGAWHQPAKEHQPVGSEPFDEQAVQTPFTPLDDKTSQVALRIELPVDRIALCFVLYFPEEDRWVKDGKADFAIDLPRQVADGPTPEAYLRRRMAEAEQEAEWTIFTLDTGDQLALAVQRSEACIRVVMACETPGPLVLHWGVSEQCRHEWSLPPEPYRPAGTTEYDEKAVRTPFVEQDGLRFLELVFAPGEACPAPRGLNFVLYETAEDNWLKVEGKDITVALFKTETDAPFAAMQMRELADAIIDAEVGKSSWTLMHRYNLCHDLLDRVEWDEEVMALVFVWLRYSAIRQLDWQRSYNTRPARLSHAQERLNDRLAAIYRKTPHLRPWIRLILPCCGRGGEGQRVRDEILEIMHRNNLKEVRGTFMEEWHQKLHNNTTPDDVAICRAYLDFLEADGDLDTFYETLEAEGVTRERLSSFDRPIRRAPRFHKGRKNALVKDFKKFFSILCSVHDGTDLATSIASARPYIPPKLAKRAAKLLKQSDDATATVVARITRIRTELREQIQKVADDHGLLQILFLDLSLEEWLRVELEKCPLSQLDLNTLVSTVGDILQNLTELEGNKAYSGLVRHWERLADATDLNADWALHAKSVIEQLNHLIQRHTDALHQVLQPKATYLGKACGVAEWTIPIFSEEVIRGGLIFLLSNFLRHLDVLLRERAGLGGWQVVSPAKARGRIRVIKSLIDVQADTFDEATLLVADAVYGDEEIPEGVAAVITCDTPDLVSHVAVRARNTHVLMASCFDPDIYNDLKVWDGQILTLSVNPGGDVTFAEGGEPLVAEGEGAEGGDRMDIRRRPFAVWVVGEAEFSPALVGGKANNLNSLRGRVSDWIGLPASMALPFGVCDKVLAHPVNRDLQALHADLCQDVESNEATVLPKLRTLFTQLNAPEELRTAVAATWQTTGLPACPWEQIWQSITRVWAAKWNDRAFYSRRAHNIPHENLQMAVLIQEVIAADYAFVIHTVNPITGNRDEIFAEVVLGLGETLVGNYPGRALGFTCHKESEALRILSYPSKSVGLYGEGVIFRSDSNGEDLEGFAGAGLYDSFLAEEATPEVLDYSNADLLWDRDYRDRLLRTIARVGKEVEAICGSPQDIEGVIQDNQYYVVQTRPQVGLA